MKNRFVYRASIHMIVSKYKFKGELRTVIGKIFIKCRIREYYALPPLRLSGTRNTELELIFLIWRAPQTQFDIIAGTCVQDHDTYLHSNLVILDNFSVSFICSSTVAYRISYSI